MATYQLAIGATHVGAIFPAHNRSQKTPYRQRIGPCPTRDQVRSSQSTIVAVVFIAISPCPTMGTRSRSGSDKTRPFGLTRVSGFNDDGTSKQHIVMLTIFTNSLANASIHSFPSYSNRIRRLYINTVIADTGSLCHNFICYSCAFHSANIEKH
jgi:hypothetical protein